MSDKYRFRVYGEYLRVMKHPIVNDTSEGFQPRKCYFNKLIREHFPNNRKSMILDMGCGHGTLIHFARKLGYENIRGVDISPQQVAVSMGLFVEGIEQGDVMETLVKELDESFDCVVAFDLIEHFNRDELIQLTDSVHRVLRPNGRWIIHTPNAESPFGMRMRYWDITHELAFTRTSLSQVLLSAGFSQVNCYEDQPIPHGVKSATRWVFWKIIRSLLRFYIAVETGDTGRETIFSQNFIAVAFK
jgi:SAM-dependent methyltransferase